ncbi:unnamed protein product [Urochloa decumbens]|uniref:KIB1-4 beta-propeller domain-containing protein n=1 Tax=Urochloa decumbens TaxID=240449 RepID=A0ABC9DB37_9POAL
MTSSSRLRRRRRRGQRNRQIDRAAAAVRAEGIEKGVVELLPAGVHAEIYRRLPFLHRMAFASLCTVTGHMLRPEAPWLILPGEAPAAKEEKKTTASYYEEYSDQEPEEYKPMREPEEEDPDALVTGEEEKSTVLSMADRGSKAGYEASVRTSGLALLDRVIIGSTGGWLVTADEKGTLRMANPATGAQAALPAITTIPFLHSTGGGSWFVLDVEPFVRVRFGGALPPANDKDWGPFPPRTYTLTAAQMRLKFYRKVVLSSSPRPGSYAAMLIPERHIGAPAFATSEDGAWRMAPSHAGIEDAIHHGGRFISVSYNGDIEAWRRDAATGEYSSEAVAPRLAFGDGKHPRRKYLAASPDGRLMAVLKHTKEVELQEHGYGRNKVTRVVFEVRVLDAAAGRWVGADDIGDAALFVGINGTVCVKASEHQGVEEDDTRRAGEHQGVEEDDMRRGVQAGCVYFTDDEVGEACLRRSQGVTTVRYGYNEPDETELQATGVYSLREGEVTERIAEKSDKQLRWPPPAWFTPSFL